MKAKFFIVIFIISFVASPSYSENTYNFYFDSDEKKEEKEQEIAHNSEPEAEQKKESRTGFLSNIISYSDTYFSIGNSIETFDKTSNTRWDSWGSGSRSSWSMSNYSTEEYALQLNAKLLPLIGFELAVKPDDPGELARGAAYLEATLFRYLSLRLLGGLVRMEHDGYKADQTTYIGVGASLRLFKTFLLSGSYNVMDRGLSFSNQNSRLSFDDKFFTVNLSVDLFNIANLF